jgi:hypothetical protein
MIFATFAAGSVLCAGLLAYAVLSGDGSAIAGYGIGLIFFGYPTCRVSLWLLDHRFGCFGGRFAGPPPARQAVRRVRVLTPRRLLAALADYVLAVTLAALAVLLLGLMA